MKLSVIIPVREIDEYLINCIDSIVNQNVTDYEVIVIDEEVTDNSTKLLSKYQNINNLKVFNYNNLVTEGSSLNFGLSKCSGEYVMFVLGTDYLEDNFLKEVYEYLGDCDLFKYDFSLLGSELKKEKTNNINEEYIIKRKLLIDNKVVINKDDFYSNLTIVPYLLTISEKFNNSNLTGYVYRTENNSFRKSFLDTPRKMAYDVLSKYEYLESLNFTAIYSEEQKSTLLDYISKKVMHELKNLKGKEKKEFKKIIKNKKIKNNIKKESFFKKLLGR